MKKCLIVLVISLLLCGCTPQMQDYTLSTAPTEQLLPTDSMVPLETRPYREYATYPVEHPAPNVWGNMVFSTKSKIVHYYDMELRRQVVLCSQPNCTHSSEDCTAYLGGSGSTTYQVVGDDVASFTVDINRLTNNYTMSLDNMGGVITVYEY